MAPGGPEQVPGWFMMPMGGAGQPTSDLDLRFPLILAHLSILAYVFRGFEPQEGLWRALGGLWDGPDWARAGARMVHDAHGKCWAAHE